MDDLRERVEAVERAVTDGEGELTALADGAARAERVATLEDDLETLQADLAEVEAATQALRGYVGNVRSANESVEARADSAVAAVEALEERVDALETQTPSGEPPAGSDTGVPMAAERPPATDEPSGPHTPAIEQGEHPSDSPSARRTEPDGTEATRQEACHVCGRGARTEPAADGGARSATQVNQSEPRQRGTEAGIGASPASTDRSVGGVDPTDEAHRVRIDHDGHNGPDGPREHPAEATGAEGTPAPGVLDRLRELL